MSEISSNLFVNRSDSKGSESAILSEEDVRSCQLPGLTYDKENYMDVIRRIPETAPNQQLVCGIAWGYAADNQNGGDLVGKSCTAFTLSIFTHDNEHIKQRLIYHKLYPLSDFSDAKAAIDDVLDKVRKLPSGALVTADYMGGAYANSTIFGISKEFAARNLRLSVLNVRFASMTSLMEAKREEFRVDVDRNFIISRFIRKKILDRCLELPSSTAQLDEVVDSWTSMKSVTSEDEPGDVMWILEKSRSNGIAMAMIAAWVAFCASNAVSWDIMR